MMSRPVRAAILSFLVSRALLFGMLVLGSQMTFLGKVYSNSVWETRTELHWNRLVPELKRISMPGDAWWYRSVALEGYGPRKEAGGAPNYAFFPLYPLLVRYASAGYDFTLTGLVLSNLAFGCALLLLGLIAVRSGLSENDAERAVVFLAFFPTSYFCSMPLPESLFLVLSLGSVLAALANRWFLAGAIAGLAALTRLPGLLLFLPLAILFFRSGVQPRIKSLSLLLVPAGTAVFLLYLYRLTGDAFAFLNVQKNWGRTPGAFWTPMLRYLQEPSMVGEPWNLTVMNFGFALLLFVAAIALLVQRRWEWGTYTLASLLLPLSTGTLQSLGRYAVVIFPLYFWLAIVARRPMVERLLFAVQLTLFGWLIAMFILRVDFALA